MKNWKQESELKQILKKRKREKQYINLGWVLLGLVIGLALVHFGVHIINYLLG